MNDEIKEWREKLLLAQIDKDYHKQNYEYFLRITKRYEKHITYLEKKQLETL